MGTTPPHRFSGRLLPPDQIEGFAEVPSTEHRHKVTKAFQPSLTVLSGCVPYPAVDARGNVSAGQDGDSIDTGCTATPGQVYCRTRAHGDYLAVVYAWYFPKDCPAPGYGHRHDWEAAVLWLDKAGSDRPALRWISYYQHGQYLAAAPTAQNTSRGRVLFAYRHDFPANNCMMIHDTLGQDSLTIHWIALTQAAHT